MIENISSSLQHDPGPRVAIAVDLEADESIEQRQPPPLIAFGAGNQYGDISIRDMVTGNLYNLILPNVSPTELRRLLRENMEVPQTRQSITLRPGNSLVKHFVLKTNRWLIFSPIAHTFHIQVRYEVDDQNNVDTIPFSLNIRSSMTSSLIGSILGSIFGTIASQKVNFTNSIETLQTLTVAIIFEIIIVVAFARKSNVQQIASVEDFWGGLFIGFLVGYSGESFINSIIGTK